MMMDVDWPTTEGICPAGIVGKHDRSAATGEGGGSPQETPAEKRRPAQIEIGEALHGRLIFRLTISISLPSLSCRRKLDKGRFALAGRVKTSAPRCLSRSNASSGFATENTMCSQVGLPRNEAAVGG